MGYLEKTKDIFKKAVGARASDLHLISGEKPAIRVDDRLLKIEDEEVLSSEATEQLILVTMRPEYVERLKSEKEVDFSFNYDGARIRANIYFEQGHMAGAFRFISEKVRLVEELGLPPIIQEFANREQGLVIISGPTGHGKSTTIAALIEYVNRNHAKHIVTVEDPIEYVFSNEKCIINQRELGTDTLSFPRALRSVLREDPDVVFIGEMRDLDTFEAALTIAETGHLVFSTLHTNNSAQTADRIVDMFPKNQQSQIRQQLANVLVGVVSQRLLQKASGEGRIPACEIMVVNSAIASLIREGRTHQVQSVIQTSASEGMITLDKVLSDLVSRGEVTLEEAIKWTSDVKEFKKMVF
jgi:twitching motility protein PilT